MTELEKGSEITFKPKGSKKELTGTVTKANNKAGKFEVKSAGKIHKIAGDQITAVLSDE